MEENSSNWILELEEALLDEVFLYLTLNCFYVKQVFRCNFLFLCLGYNPVVCCYWICSWLRLVGKWNLATFRPVFGYTKCYMFSLFSSYSSGTENLFTLLQCCGSGFIIQVNLDPGVWWPKNWKNKWGWNFCFVFWSKIAIYLSLGLRKERPSFKRSL
jgi:hypothetical protein